MQASGRTERAALRAPHFGPASDLPFRVALGDLLPFGDVARAHPFASERIQVAERVEEERLAEAEAEEGEYRGSVRGVGVA